MRLRKEGIELDIVWTTNQAILESAIEVDYDGIKLKVITPEVLFITKLNNQIASPNRTDEKRARDREVINELRKKIDVKKLNDLISELKPEFWTKREW